MRLSFRQDPDRRVVTGGARFARVVLTAARTSIVRAVRFRSERGRGWTLGAVYLLFVTQTLDIAPTVLALMIASGNLGGMFGALVTGWLTRRFGVGPTTVGIALAGSAWPGRSGWVEPGRS